MIKLSSKKKTIFSITSIIVLILIVILLPKSQTKNNTYETPRTSVRYIPPPTPSPNIYEGVLTVQSQPPGDKLSIQSIKPIEPVYLVVEKDGEILWQSEFVSEEVNNLEVPLGEETKDGDVLFIKLINEEEKEVYKKEVLILTTALSPNIILPKDLQ